MSLESQALHCSECSVPVGSDGPQRAALLLPCEHVTHVSCAEFVARKVKYFRRLTSGDAAELVDEGVAGAANFFCPGCGEEVERIVPLYLAHEPPPPPANASVCAHFDRAHEAQRQCLRSLRRLWEVKGKVVDLGHRCAALHTQRAAHLRELEQYQLIFSPLATVDVAAAQSAAARTASRIGEMSVSELELYLGQSTPALLHAQSSLRRERRQLDQRKKKLEALRKQYQMRKELAHLNNLIDSAEGTVGKAAAVGGSDGESLEGSVPFPHARSLHTMSAYVAAAEGTSAVRPASPARVGLKRRRERDVVNVDALAAPVRPRGPADRRVHRLDEAERVGSQGSDDDEVTVVPVSAGTQRTGARRVRTSPEVIDVDGEEEADSAAPEMESRDLAESEDWLAGAFVTLDPGEVAEAMGETLPVFVPCLFTKPSNQAPLHSNHLRLLPRREDRLWQPSLQF